MNSAFVRYKELRRPGGCYPSRPSASVDNTLPICSILHILRKRNSLIAKIIITVVKLNVNPLLSIPGGLFISSPFEGGGGGGLIESGGISFRNNDGISSSQRTRIPSGKAQVQEVLGHAVEDQNQIRSSGW